MYPRVGRMLLEETAWIVAAAPIHFTQTRELRHTSVICINKLVTEKAPPTLPGLACLCAQEKVASFDCQLVTISFHLCGRIGTLKPRTGEKVSVQVPGVK